MPADWRTDPIERSILETIIGSYSNQFTCQPFTSDGLSNSEFHKTFGRPINQRLIRSPFQALKRQTRRTREIWYVRHKTDKFTSLVPALSILLRFSTVPAPPQKRKLFLFSKSSKSFGKSGRIAEFHSDSGRGGRRRSRMLRHTHSGGKGEVPSQDREASRAQKSNFDSRSFCHFSHFP
jgi:hypothetical protein